MGSDLDERIDALFRLPLAEFIAARNALAAELKRAGDDAHSTVKALARPAAPAWGVNQLWYRDREAFESLLDAGERLRAEQQRGLQGRGRSGPGAADMRRKAVATLLERARSILAEDGRPATAATLKRVEKTLQALADLGRGGSDEPPGRLTRDVEPPGFEALLALAASAPLPEPPPTEPRPGTAKDPEPAAPPTDAEPDPAPESEPEQAAPVRRRSSKPDAGRAREASRRAQARVADAVEALEAAREAAAESEAVRAAAAGRVRQTVAEVSRLKTELSRAERSAERARVALERAETRKEQATEAVGRAEEALADARVDAERARFDPGG